MKIWIAPYSLVPRSRLSGRMAAEPRPGALLKIEFEPDLVGYADVHPWVPLGDEPLHAQLSSLSMGVHTPLSERSIALARLDAAARAKGRSAFEGYVIPESHLLVGDVETLSLVDLQGAKSEGYGVIKVKVGRSPVSDASKLNEFAQEIASNFRLRLDFNGMLTPESYVRFIEQLMPEVRSAIEFVEDPVPFANGVWHQIKIATNVPLALDRATEEELTECKASAEAPSFDWIICKPATQDPRRILDLATHLNRRIAVTSYLDHPVGQLGAALEAARLLTSSPEGGIGACGLVSHRAFVKNDFSERLAAVGPRLQHPGGTGIGFDDLLERQTWTELC